MVESGESWAVNPFVDGRGHSSRTTNDHAIHHVDGSEDGEVVEHHLDDFRRVDWVASLRVYVRCLAFELLASAD